MDEQLKELRAMAAHLNETGPDDSSPARPVNRISAIDEEDSAFMERMLRERSRWEIFTKQVLRMLRAFGDSPNA